MKKENAMKKLLGGGTAVILSLAMALCIFTGMGMEVRAAEEWYFEEVAPPSNTGEDEWKSNIFIEGTCSDDVLYAMLDHIKNNPYDDNDIFVFFYEYIASVDKNNYICYTKHGVDDDYDDGYECGYFSAMISTWAAAPHMYILKQRTTSDTSGTSQKSGSDTPSYVHTHSYSWVTVQEADSGQDGIEEYRCSCGDVQERNIIPASEVLVKGLFGEIKDAPLNGSATFDTGRQYTLSDHIIRKLSERADVTTVITFEYEGQSYRMTIPAGADYSQLLADEDYFYGYFYFANAVGAVIEAL